MPYFLLKKKGTDMNINRGTFCFLKDQYYIDFPDKDIQINKDKGINGNNHNRPFFLAIPDENIKEIFWIIPVSTKIEKYKKVYDKKIEKIGICDTLHFGNIGHLNGADVCFLSKTYALQLKHTLTISI